VGGSRNEAWRSSMLPCSSSLETVSVTESEVIGYRGEDRGL